MSDCCSSDSDNGLPVGTRSSDFSYDFTTVGAVTNTVQLASLPVNGANIMLRGFTATAINETVGSEGQGAGQWSALEAFALRNAVDGSLLFVDGVAPSAPSVAWVVGSSATGAVRVGYGVGPAFGAPLLTFTLTIAANVLQFAATGLAATTFDWKIRGQLWVARGAVRL